MTTKEYCSTVCKAKCCRAEHLIKSPCPKLGEDNLCSIYETRLGFIWPIKNPQGNDGHCKCCKIEEVLPKLPPEVRDQCCYHNPDLLKP